MRRRARRSLAWLPACAVVLAGGCGDAQGPAPPGPRASAPVGPPWFEDQAAARGVDFTWISGHADRYYIPESIGGGAALFDMDADGDLDLYCVQGGGIAVPPDRRAANRLFENDGAGRFTDVTDGSGAGDRGFGQGVAAGDYDNDGDVDLYVTNVGSNVLLRNDGGGRFTDVTAEAGVGDPGWGSSTVFLDYDVDGDLDLFVCNYLNWSVDTEIDCYNSAGRLDYCLPANYGAPARDVLYRNEGDGTFVDATETAGLTEAVGTGLGVTSADFNRDGWPDLFVANDGMPDQLWFNRRDGTFLEFGMTIGVALDMEGKAKAGMGVAVIDIDGDLDQDLLVCNLRDESDSFFINDIRYFTDATIPVGLGFVSRRFTRFGLGFADFDNDGLADLYEANGRIQFYTEVYGDDVYAEPNLLFRGLPGPAFEEVLPRGGTAELLVHSSRGAAFGDVDDDGGVDVVVSNRDAPAYLLHNIVPARGHWVSLSVLESCGRPALGAQVRIELPSGPVQREVRAAYSFLSSNDPRVHVGLGDEGGPVDVTVQWLDGTIERFPGVPADRVSELRRGRGG